MQEFISSLTNLLILAQVNLKLTLILIGLLWGLHIINFVCGSRFNRFGLYPRHLRGLPGIFLCTVLHFDFNHLFFNSVPLFILSNIILLEGQKTFFIVSLMIIIMSGLALWLFGRKAIYVGASNLVMGYFGYILASAYYQSSTITIVLAILCLYYLGGMFLALFPSSRRVAWEGHICGFAAGIATAYLYPLFF